MSGISSGIGLISGIDSASLIDQLIALESRPVDNLRTRSAAIDTRRASLLNISARLLAIRNAVTGFHQSSFLRRFSASTSNESIATATAGDTAVPGSITFRVRSVVANHSVISRGFADANQTRVGAGTISLEVGRGRVNESTLVEALNGHQGIRRGVITITDRAGNTADVDLTAAMTVDDILDAINGAGLNVRARVTGIAYQPADGPAATGDRIVIEDVTSDGATVGNLTVTDKQGSVARDLGIVASVAASRIDGQNLIRLTMDTPLSVLNDGNGVGRRGRLLSNKDLEFSTANGSFSVSLSDVLDPSVDLRMLNDGLGVRLGVFRVNDRAGKSFDVDLTDLNPDAGVTVQQVLDRITTAAQDAGSKVTATTVNSRIQISDASTPTGDAGTLTVEDVTGSSAADLGIAGEAESGGIGRDVYRISSLGDVIRAINFAAGNNRSLVRASISDDGSGIQLQAVGPPGQTVTVQAAGQADGASSTAAADLGIDGAQISTDAVYRSRPLLAGLNTVLLSTLRGGDGLAGGRISFQDASGSTTEIDFTQARTLLDVVDMINADNDTALVASINAAGNGVMIRDESGGNSNVVVTDLGGGSLAAELGIAGNHEVAGGRDIDGGNLQRQYITRNTHLTDLLDTDVVNGTFRITDSNGTVASVRVDSVIENVGQIVDAINRAGPNTLVARINDNGDGILVTDTSAGAQSLTIEDTTGRIAQSLHLAGTAATGSHEINGSFETRIDVAAGDTLTDVARKINEAGAGATANVLNDGSSGRPFSLAITSQVTGSRGVMMIDPQGVDLGFETLTRGSDAVVALGESGGESASRLVASSTNQFKDVLEGVTFDVLAASDESVSLTVADDVDGIVASIQTFVDAFNDTLDTIDESTSFNQETFERGPLFGDSTTGIIRNRLITLFSRTFGGDGTIDRMFEVGLRTGSGNRLQFDEQRFRDALAADRPAVEELFANSETGFGQAIQDMLDGLTDDTDGVISRRTGLLQDQQELLNDRIDSLNVLIAAKRARLEAQFIGLERALAGLQNQQTSLSALAALSGAG